MLYIDTSLLKKQSLSDLLIWHSRTKCLSLSISLQWGIFFQQQVLWGWYVYLFLILTYVNCNEISQLNGSIVVFKPGSIE